MKHGNYDVIIIGGGPAGAFCAYEMIKMHPEKRVCIVERGKRVENRICPESSCGKCIKCKPFCNITNGFSGAGAFSDGKLSLYNHEDDEFYVGGNLHKYIGVDETKRVIDYTDKVYLDFGATTKLEGTEYRSEVSKIRKSAEKVGLDLINIPIRHLGTDKAHKLYQNIEEFLEENGVEVIDSIEVTDLIVKDNKCIGVEIGIDNKIYSEKVVVAVGRVGSDWLLNMCEKHKIASAPSYIDIGVRYELPDDIMENVNKFMYEGKFIGKPNPFNDKVRTFCQNPSGFVSAEVYDGGLTLVNGHSCKDKKSTNTNLALLVSANLYHMANPMEFARNIARNLNALTKEQNVLVQRLGDIVNGKRTWPKELENNSVVPTLKSAEPGDLSYGFPHRIMTDILEFIRMLDNVFPGFANEDNLLYGPEIKFYSNKVELTSNLETSVKNLYAIGDGCGLTRGLMMASASGVSVARKIYE